jgi:ornithine cyclodeaminase/alanine dehydrogenase-like protein (mu-crystallin family)
MNDRLLYLSGPELAELVSLDECVEVLERSLREGSVDPEADSPRLFSDLRAGEFLCAVGAHGLNRREVPAALALRSDVVVEGRGSAMREAGNLIPARSAEEWSQQPLSNLTELVAGKFVRRLGHPALYSGVGMAWEDLVVAGHIYTQQLKKWSGV